jgi:hypothetical protein
MARTRVEKYIELLPNGDSVEREAITKINNKIALGWNMTYKDPLYDFIEILTKSQFKLYRALERIILSKSGFDVYISIKDLMEHDVIKVLTSDRKKLSKMLTLMVKHNIVMETGSKYYRFNPFIIVPMYGQGECLQDEWNNLRKMNKFKRRGRDILDEYYLFKAKTNNPKLTFEEWFEDNSDITIEPGVVYSNKYITSK